MPTASLDLPFAVPAKERDKTCTVGMEVAAILLMAEAKRGKPGLLGGTSGKISFLSKLHYPLWAVPWENGSLIIDGLGMSPSVIAKQQLPDVAQFLEDIERGASAREQFRNALEKHLNTFSDFAGRVHMQMDALMADKDLLADLSEHAKETSDMKTESIASNIVLTPLKLDVQAALETAKLTQDLNKQLHSETDSLEYAKNLLADTTKLHEQMIAKEIEYIREGYDARVAKIKPAIEAKVDQILKDRDARMAKMNRLTETELQAKGREKQKRERELQKLELGKADMVRKREARKRKHDKIGETHWEHRIRINENKADELNARIRALTEFMEKTRAQADADLERLNQGFQWLIDQERRKIVDIEVQRDDALAAKQRETEALKLVAGKIGERIEALRRRKMDEEDETKRLAISSQFSDVTLLCLPFYLVGYQTDNTTRFHIFPPVKLLGSEGAITAIRKKLRDVTSASRISLFFKPRSKAVSRLLEFMVEEKLKSDKAFKDSLVETATSANMLFKDGLRGILAKGMAELKAEGWITPKEENLMKLYT